MTENRYLIISGSQNLNSQSRKISDVVRQRLAALSKTGSASVFDLAETPLPFLGAPMDAADKERLQALGEQCTSATGLVFVTPEWHGMAPAALKNFFLLFSRGQLAHKPALIVAVSASVGGSYPIAELRMSSYKNSRVCFLPEQLIVRQVNQVFNADGDNDERSHNYLSQRLDFCIDMLESYAEAFTGLRANLPDLSAYDNGM